MKLCDLIAAKLHAHLIDLLHTNAVFAGDGATDLDTQFQNFSTQFFGTFQLCLLYTSDAADE